MTSTQQHGAKGLKNIDFVAWRVGKAQKARQQEEINRCLFERPRLRRDTRH